MRSEVTPNRRWLRDYLHRSLRRKSLRLTSLYGGESAIGGWNGFSSHGIPRGNGGVTGIESYTHCVQATLHWDSANAKPLLHAN